MLKLYSAHTDDRQALKFTLKEIQNIINTAQQSELLPDSSLHILTADKQHFYIAIPTAETETIFPIAAGFIVGRKILDEKSQAVYLCEDGKIRELPPPRCGI